MVLGFEEFGGLMMELNWVGLGWEGFVGGGV